MEGMQLIELKEEWRSFGRSAFGALPYYCLYFIFYFQLPDPAVVRVFLVFVLGQMAYWVATSLAPMNHEDRQTAAQTLKLYLYALLYL